MYSLFCFQNILDNFNPTSRQMIAAGKAYLKSLHGKSQIITILYVSYFEYNEDLQILDKILRIMLTSRAQILRC
jgi:hypothetical protein